MNEIEILDLYDSKKIKIGKTIMRNIQEPGEGEYKLSIHVWIVNNKGEFLIQKRRDDLKRHPGKWGFTGGAVSSGEDSLEGAIREVKEELSIDIDKKNIELLFSIKRKYDFVDVWLLKGNYIIEELVLQKEEVSEAKWVNISELLEIIDSGKFVSSVDLYKELLVKMIKE